MQRSGLISLLALAGLSACASGGGGRSTLTPRDTRLVTHVVTYDAKLIGTAVGGARVVVRDAATNRILAEGQHMGGTGDTKRIMQDARARGDTVFGTAGAARYEVSLSIAKPTVVDISAEGPLGYPDQMMRTTKRMLLLPGHDIVGDGVVLELHGFVVDIMSPDTTQALPKSAIKVRAQVRMLCSCPTQPGGMWEAGLVTARIVRDSTVMREAKLAYAGTASMYEGELDEVEPGVYFLEVLASAPKGATFGYVRRRITIAK